MEKKIKITWHNYGTINAVIIKINYWNEFENSAINNGVLMDCIIKIERIQEADEMNVNDTTV